MRWISATALSICAALGMPAAAIATENYALLIGASEYTNLDKRFWLAGPANDIDLVHTYLLQNKAAPFKPKNITILADGVPGMAAPTLAAIRTEMAALTQRLSPGDFVYLHFSGHGTQAPALDPTTELDGLDELFLPVDIGAWNDTTGRVENALVDDEIGEMIAALRATGANIWAVFDSCHSGTVTRTTTGSDDLRLRKLDPQALKIPDDQMEQAEMATRTRSVNPRTPDEPAIDTHLAAATGSSTGPNTEPGTFVAFYAAQSNEATPEKRLPRGKPGRRSQGVFTYTLFEALAAYPMASYEDLGKEVLRRYTVERQAQSTPMFVGDLNAPVFGRGDATVARQWPLILDSTAATARISAGRLHGLDTGARLAVLASPADPDSAALGLVEVTQADTFSADLIAVTQDGAPSLQLSALPVGAYARKLSDVLDFGMTVALPDAALNPAVQAALSAALSHAAQSELLSARITFVDPGTPADFQLITRPDSDALAIQPDSGLAMGFAASVTPLITTRDKDTETLALVLTNALAHIAKVQNLLKLSGSYAQNGLKVDVTFQTRTDNAAQLRRLKALPVPRMIPGDELHVEARNDEDGPVDLNVLYVGSDYSITHMFKGRLQPGDTLKQGLLRITADAFGRDRVIFFMTPAKPHSSVEDLGFLAQDELPQTRAAGGTAFSQSLMDAGFGNVTRAAVPLGAAVQDAPRPAIALLEIDTRPAD